MNINKLLTFSFASILTIVAQPAFAREFADIYSQCGLGAIIAPTNQTVAVITNITFDLGTTAVISNASSPNTCKGGRAKMAAFIHSSYAQLENDIASGSGTYLTSLISLSGRDGTVAQNREFISTLRNSFAQLVATRGYETQSQFDKSEALYNLVVVNG